VDFPTPSLSSSPVATRFLSASSTELMLSEGQRSMTSCFLNLPTKHPVAFLAMPMAGCFSSTIENRPSKSLHAGSIAPRPHFQEWQDVLLPHMPTYLGLSQSVVIEVFVLCDLSFKGDVLANVKAIAVEEQCREQPALPPIAVIELMYAKEVVDEDWDCDQRLKLKVPYGSVALLANPVQSFFCPIWRGRRRDNCEVLLILWHGSHRLRSLNTLNACAI